MVRRGTDERLGNSLTVRVATAEDLVIMKLIASRDRDLEDVARLLELHAEIDRSYVRSVVSGFAEAMEEPEVLRNAEYLGLNRRELGVR